MREPRVRVVVPTEELALSLSRRFAQFPGEQGIDFDGSGDGGAVVLVEFPRDTAGLDRVLDVVRSWLSESGLPSVSVESRWLIASGRPIGNPAGAVRGRVTWKYEDGPANAPVEASPDDVGPAWIDHPGNPESEPVANGEWISRAEARRFAAERGYELSEDD